jgi:two-component system, sensor histidine kinase and response regulator
VKRYLALVGATISVQSAKGTGTTFTLRFGSGAGAAAAAAGPAGARMREGGGKPIVLLVDDDEDTVEYCTYLLQHGFTLRSAQSAAQARVELAAHDVAIVLMDISLRGGTNGLQLTRELRGDARHARLPIIAVTAHAFEKDRQDCLDAGCTAYVTKPIDAIPFRALVARLASASETGG